MSLVIYPEFEILAIYLIVIARAAVQAVRAARKAGDMMRGSALLAVVVGDCGAGRRAARWRRRSTPTCWCRSSATPSRCSGSICCSATPACCRSATPCSSGSAPMARRSSPACSASGTSRRCWSASRWPDCVVAAADRPAVRALHRHLLRHADAGVRHAGALVPVQVLPPDRRRQRHARAAHVDPGAGVRSLQQDRAAGRAVLLLLPGAAGARGVRHVAHRAIRRSGCTCRRCATTRRRRNTSACACASSGWRHS